MNNEINKSFLNNIDSFDMIPDKIIYYKTRNSQKLKLYKGKEVFIFYSENLAPLPIKHDDVVFWVGTFYSFPQFENQLLITRVFESTLNSFYTTYYSWSKR